MDLSPFPNEQISDYLNVEESKMPGGHDKKKEDYECL